MGKWAVTVRSAASDREINDCFVYDDSDNYEGQTGEEGRILLDGGSPYIFRKRGFIEFSTAEFEDPPEENQKNVTVRLEQEAGVGDDVAGSDWEPSIHFFVKENWGDMPVTGYDIWVQFGGWRLDQPSDWKIVTNDVAQINKKDCSLLNRSQEQINKAMTYSHSTKSILQRGPGLVRQRLRFRFSKPGSVLENKITNWLNISEWEDIDVNSIMHYSDRSDDMSNAEAERSASDFYYLHWWCNVRADFDLDLLIEDRNGNKVPGKYRFISGRDMQAGDYGDFRDSDGRIQISSDDSEWLIPDMRFEYQFSENYYIKKWDVSDHILRHFDFSRGQDFEAVIQVWGKADFNEVTVKFVDVDGNAVNNVDYSVKTSESIIVSGNSGNNNILEIDDIEFNIRYHITANHSNYVEHTGSFYVRSDHVGLIDDIIFTFEEEKEGEEEEKEEEDEEEEEGNGGGTAGPVDEDVKQMFKDRGYVYGHTVLAFRGLVQGVLQFLPLILIFGFLVLILKIRRSKNG